MSKGIELSPEYGLNPTLPVCFFCGEEKNEIALMGRMRSRKGARDDLEAPKRMLLDYEPCDKCREKFSQGVLLIEVNSYPMADNQPPIQEGAYPTGKYVVVNPEALVEDFKAGSRALVLHEDFELMFPGV